MKKIKIAYIGGGSRSWARILMTDLATEKEICGEVHLYDIDFKSSRDNEIIGNGIKFIHGATDNFKYVAQKTIDSALIGADFVIISILPGTLDEMAVDVHVPEKYGIYQSVGDTVGPGGIVRSLRTIPMIKYIAEKIRERCPDAWVINYTNPMAICVKTLYKTFPDIKAYGCCHEVFGTRKLINSALKRDSGLWRDIKVNVSGVNHFTWFTQVTCEGKNVLPEFEEFCRKHYETGYLEEGKDPSIEPIFSLNRVKFDLFLRYGTVAAAGDRHLVEFLPKQWYLKDKNHPDFWGYKLTSVDYRKNQYRERLEETVAIRDGKKQFVLTETGEEGVKQIKALLGYGDLVTNVNMPNRGQMEGLPLGAIVETNVKFSKDSVKPMYAGSLPCEVLALVYRAYSETELCFKAGYYGDYENAFKAFINDPLVDLDFITARHLFDEMLEGTKKYLPFFNEYLKERR